MEDIIDAVSMGGVCPLDVAATDIEEVSSLSNESVADSGIASSLDSVAEPLPKKSEPEAQSEEVRLAMEELHRRVERALSEERAGLDSENNEKDLTSKSGEDSEEIPCKASQPQEESTHSGRQDLNNTTASSKDKDLPDDSNEVVEKVSADSEEVPCKASQAQEKSTLSAKLAKGQEDTTLPSEDKGLPDDTNEVVKKDPVNLEDITCDTSQDKGANLPSTDSSSLLKNDQEDTHEQNEEFQSVYEKIRTVLSDENQEGNSTKMETTTEKSNVKHD